MLKIRTVGQGLQQLLSHGWWTPWNTVLPHGSDCWTIPHFRRMFWAQLEGTQPLSELSIIIQIIWWDQTAFLIITHSTLPNEEFLTSSHKSQKNERHFHADDPSSHVPLCEQGWANETVSRMSTPANSAFPTAWLRVTNHTSYTAPPYVTHHSALAGLSRIFSAFISSHLGQEMLR